MKKLSIAISISVLTPMIASCAHHPIPRDVIRKATRGIVESIRCETRRGIELVVADEFERIGKKREHKFTTDTAIAIRNETIPNYSKFRKYFVPRIHKEARSVFLRYKDYAVAYNFDFTITENNNESANTTFAVPIPNGTFTLGLGAGHNRQRKNLRTVYAEDSFEELFTKLDDKDCAKSQKEQKNWDYPIAGKIGMHEVVETFIGVNEDLRDQKKPKLSEGVKTFADELTYTTTYLGTVTPRVVLTPVTDKFHLTSAEGTFTANRTDQHKVKLAFTAPPVSKPDKPLKVLIVNDRIVVGAPAKQGVTQRRVRAAPRMSAGERAKQKARRDLNSLVREQFIRDTRDLID